MANKVRLSASDISKKWSERTSGATEAYKKGVNNVTESPTAKAANNLDKALANYTKAINSGKMAKTLNAVTLADWKSKTSELGSQRLATGVQGALAKRQKFDTALVNHLNAELPAIDQMKVLTLEDGINKAAAMIRAMAKFQYKATM